MVQSQHASLLIRMDKVEGSQTELATMLVIGSYDGYANCGLNYLSLHDALSFSPAISSNHQHDMLRNTSGLCAQHYTQEPELSCQLDSAHYHLHHL